MSAAPPNANPEAPGPPAAPAQEPGGPPAPPRPRPGRGRKSLAAALCALTALVGVGLWRVTWASGEFRAGEAALERYDFSAADSHLANYLRIWPGSASGHLLAARAARGLGRYDDAEAHLEAARRAGAAAEDLSLEEYLLDAQRGSWTASAEWVLWHRVKEGHPQAPRILEAMAGGYLQSYRLGEAMEAVARWRALDPDCAQALYFGGLLYEGVQDLASAERDYREAVRLDPHHVAARQRLGELLLTNHQAREALDHIEHALSRRPADSDLRLALARCRRLLGQSAEARQILDALLAERGDSFAALAERGRVAAGEGGHAEAVDFYRRAYALDSYDSDTCYALGRSLRALGETAEADRLLARGKAIDRDVAVLRELHRQIGRKPDDPELRYQAGLICARNGQPAEARRWLSSVLRLAPDHAAARQALAGAR